MNDIHEMIWASASRSPVGNSPASGKPILLENCRRLDGNRPLLNVVDKEKWY